jgi:hypothetical protein
MKVSPHKLLSAVTAIALVSAFATPAHAQGARSEDRLRHFQMSMIDVDKDGFVSKKEFVDTMSRMWDMKMSDMAKAQGGDAAKALARMKDRMTIDQYREFAKMFGLDIGS